MQKSIRFLAGTLALTSASVFGQPRSADLEASVDEGFTVAAVGDIIIAHPLTHFTDDPGFAEVVELIREADIATGNLETQIIDGRNFRGSGGGGRHGAEPRSAEFLRDIRPAVNQEPERSPVRTDCWQFGPMRGQPIWPTKLMPCPCFTIP